MQAGIYPEVPDDYGSWLSGFIDGEGCFYIQRWNKTRCEGYTPVFALTVRDDDRPAIEAAQSATGLGVVKQALGSRSPRSNPTVVWRIWRKQDCRRLVELLDRFPLRSKKAADYALWRDAVRLWYAPPAVRDWSAIGALRDEMKRGRAYDAEPAVVAEAEPGEPQLWAD